MTNSVQLSWTWSGSIENVSGIAVNVRDLVTGAVVAGYPITLAANRTNYNFSGLATEHNYRFSISYTAANSGYLSGGSSVDVKLFQKAIVLNNVDTGTNTAAGITNAPSVVFPNIEFIPLIPDIMRKKGWNTAAELMEYWFKRSGKTYKLEFDKIKSLSKKQGDDIDKLINEWKNPSFFDKSFVDYIYSPSHPRSLLVRELGRLDSNGTSILSVGGVFDHTYSELLPKNTEGWAVGADETKTMHWIHDAIIAPSVFDDIGEYAAAIERGALRLVAKGSVSVSNLTAKITITGVGIYFRDSYDFYDDPGGNQSLGCWRETVPYVSSTCYSNTDGSWKNISNATFRQYNLSNSRAETAGNYRIFSEMKTFDYAQPYVFYTSLTGNDLDVHIAAINKMFALTESMFPNETRSSASSRPKSFGNGNYAKYYDVSGTSLYYYDGCVYFSPREGQYLKVGYLNDWINALQ